MSQWPGTTYGGGRLHAWLIAALRFIDVRLLYLFSAIFIVPVCLVLNPSRRTAYHYFRQRMGLCALYAAWKTYVNHCLFAQVVIDKFAMYAGKSFDVKVEGYEHFHKLADNPNEGFLQFSAHIGCYEIAGYTLVAKTKIMNALVFGGEKESVMRNRGKMFEQTNIRMIAIKDDMSHLFAINNALQNAEIVSFPADRTFGSDKTIAVNLLGAEAHLPLGPFTVATMRGNEVLAVNVMKSKTTQYTIIVTPLHYDKSAPRKQQMRELADNYIKELERVLRLYPTQWYNFYEFWK